MSHLCYLLSRIPSSSTENLIPLYTPFVTTDLTLLPLPYQSPLSTFTTYPSTQHTYHNNYPPSNIQFRFSTLSLPPPTSLSRKSYLLSTLSPLLSASRSLSFANQFSPTQTKRSSTRTLIPSSPPSHTLSTLIILTRPPLSPFPSQPHSTDEVSLNTNALAAVLAPPLDPLNRLFDPSNHYWGRWGGD